MRIVICISFYFDGVGICLLRSVLNCLLKSVFLVFYIIILYVYEPTAVIESQFFSEIL